MSNTTNKIKLVVIFGGNSSEHEVSCMSAFSVIKNADTNKYDIYKLGITKEGEWYLYLGTDEKINDLSWSSDCANLRRAYISPCSYNKGIFVLNGRDSSYNLIDIDCVFPVLHGKNGEDGTMQGLLKLSGIPYVGCDTLSAAVTMDKAMTKIIMEHCKIRQTPWEFVDANEYFSSSAAQEAIVERLEKNLSYPIFVKPANAGSSVGITKVNTRSEMTKAFEKAAAIDKRIVAEQGVKGRELEVAVLQRSVGGIKELIASKCGEIIPDGAFYDYESKYVSEASKVCVPADVSDKVNDEIRFLASRIFTHLNCRSFARVDFFLDESGELIFNEINVIPGFTSISMYPKLIENYGISYSELIDILVSEAISNKL